MVVSYVSNKLQEFFEDYRKDLVESEVEVAECKDSNGKVKSKVYFTINKNISGCDQIEMIVEPDGIKRVFYSVQSLENTFRDWIRTDGWAEPCGEPNDEEPDDAFIRDLIDERENELYGATEEFLDTISGGAFREEDYVDVMEDILELLAVNYGYSIYRPSITNNGEFTEFPYDYLTYLPA